MARKAELRQLAWLECPPEVLERLAGDPDKLTRQEVARHSASPPQVLTRLAEDPEWEVRLAVARHPACPPRGAGAAGPGP
jgi:hypothetical protein